MILADTSIWVDHFRQIEPLIAELVQTDRLVMHPFIIGELALGSFKNRQAVIADLNKLVQLLPVKHGNAMQLIETRRLHSTGLQYLDVHILAAVLTTEPCRLWTRDKRLKRAAESLGVAANLA